MSTIRDVAKEAGVSVATVSRLMNKKGYVGAETKNRIYAAIDKLNYVPNEIARSLNKQASKIIGLLVPDITNPYFPLLVRGAEQAALDKGYIVILGNTEEKKEIGNQYYNFLKQYNVSGILKLDGTDIKIPDSIPVVSIDRLESSDSYGIMTDHYYGGRLAAEAILDTNNYQNILIMAGPQNLMVSKERLQGIRDKFDEVQVTYQMYETKSFQMGYAEETAKLVLDIYPDVDTIIASNDIYALALLKEISQRGLSVPKDIQVMGYDDIIFGEYANPSLSTIHQPAYEMGYQGVELLLSLLKNSAVVLENSIIKLKPKTIIRDSLREGK